MPYSEAREWFWVRTLIWFVLAFVITGVGSFFYIGDYIETFGPHIRATLGVAFGATLFAVLAAAVSISFPWMRLGRWKLWWFNAIVCAIISGFCAAGASAIVFTIIRSNPYYAPSEAVLEAANGILPFGIAVAAGWGAIFGTWFALRLDKYFVESI